MFSGGTGIGKSSSMEILASDWASSPNQLSTNHKLNQFDFLFLIELGYVNDNSSLEKIIIKQHGLNGIDVIESQISSILKGTSTDETRVLLILDGYDEYKKGTNADIDAAIEDTIGDCFLILTSRDGGYISKNILDKMDGEIEITGFSDENILKCTARYLESDELCYKLISKAKEVGIYGLLHVPILLLMVCVLYYSTMQLPSSQTQLIWQILQMCMDRSAIKYFGMKAKHLVGLEHLLYKLGELSLRTMRRERRQLLLSKVFVAQSWQLNVLCSCV